MKKTFITTLMLAISWVALAQEEVIRKVPSFEKISVSPKISLVLEKGDKESVRLVYNNISSGKINVEVVGNTLRIYLDQARLVDKRERTTDNHNSRVSMYHDVSVTAYVTYRYVKELEMRGEETLTCESEIDVDKFKLTVYGEAEVNLASLKAHKFKASLYGVNNIKIKSGESAHQVYRLFGENKIDTRGFESITASARIYGEGRLRMKATDEVRINSFGEPDIDISGNPHISRGIMIGRTHIELHD
jgi:Putative auto-transporter adhesin, head GIN domain